MPTNRNRRSRFPQDVCITKVDAEAFIAGEGLALHRALRIKPWEFTISETAKNAKTAAEIMARRDQITAELMDFRTK